MQPLPESLISQAAANRASWAVCF